MRPNGAIAHGVANVADEQALAAKLQRDGFYLLHVRTAPSWLTWLCGAKLRFGQSTNLVLVFYELGSLLKAGLPVDRGLSTVAELLPDGAMRVALLRVRDAVRRGSALADALEAESDLFKALHVNLVRAGEAGGALDEVLLRLAEHLRRQDAVRGQVLVALIYPAILVLVGVAALLLLATVVLPQLAPIFADAGRQLPLSTRLILSGARFLRQFGWLVALLLLAAGIGLREALKQPAQRQRWDRAMLRLPLLGGVVLTVQTARFARTAGTLLKSGVALPVALGLARQTVTNTALSEALRIAATQVRGGRGLAEALQKTGLFPALAAQLVSVGEETGHLDEMLLHEAELFERGSARRIESLVAVLVPTLTILIGASVAGVLASILMAVMQLNELAS